MMYVSTRSEDGERFSASDAILKGLAPDGGLFIPESVPSIPSGFTLSRGAWYAMYQAMRPYFEGDELEDDLEEICRSAFSFPVLNILYPDQNMPASPMAIRSQLPMV